MSLIREKLVLSHSEVLYDLLRGIDLPVSEYTFANLYLFRDAHDYELITGGSSLFISGRTYAGQRYIMVTGDLRNAHSGLLDEALSFYGAVFPVPGEWTAGLDSEKYEILTDQGDSDYILSLDDMRSYSGKKLHSKKNLLNQFLSAYDHLALPLTSDRIDHALSILNVWQEESSLSETESDYGPCREALELYDELVLCGGIFYADGEPAGFIIGEELNRSVFALHFAKGRTEFKGIYEYMYNSFAGVMPSKYCCFNFEQDLGIESLRRAKGSYRPLSMVNKYMIKYEAER